MIPYATSERLRSIPWVTLSLILLNSFLFFLGFKSTAFFINGFAHGDIYHLLFNMLFLWIFGSGLEGRIGWKRFLLFYLISYVGSDIIQRVCDGRPSLGASGAISGVMGLYLTRCHYAKVKTLIPIMLIVLRVEINAKWLLVFWFLRDIYGAHYAADFVAHWAHIGGFVTGALIGIMSSYVAEGKKEHLFEKALKAIEEQHGLNEAEEDLLGVLSIAPEDPEAHYRLAQLYAMDQENKENAQKHYREATRLFHRNKESRSRAAEVFLEYLRNIGTPAPPETHLKYAVTAFNVCDYRTSADILRPILESRALRGKVGEKVFLQYIVSSLRNEAKNDADEALEQFRKRFPSSMYIKEAEKYVRSWLPRAKRKKISSAPVEDETGSNGWFVEAYRSIRETTADPLYWVILSVTLYVWVIFYGIPGIFIAIFVAFFLTKGLEVAGSFSGGLFSGGGRGVSEVQARNEFDRTMLFNRARLCDRQNRYEEAIELYTSLLEAEPENPEALFRISSILHNKLGKSDKAREYYEKIKKVLPMDHVYHREAREALKELDPPPGQNQ